MKCGSCKNDHDTVAQVRACYTPTGSVAVLERPRTDWLENRRIAADAKLAAAIASTRPEQSNVAIKVTDVPAGHYAIGDDAHGSLRFYSVDRPTDGRWKGYVFVNRCASDERYPVRARSEREAILAEIGRDVNGAMARYGQEIGKCGRCNRTLTNQASREIGIGPECLTKI